MEEYLGVIKPALKDVVKQALAVHHITYTDVSEAMKQMHEKEPEAVR